MGTDKIIGRSWQIVAYPNPLPVPKFALSKKATCMLWRKKLLN